MVVHRKQSDQHSLMLNINVIVRMRKIAGGGVLRDRGGQVFFAFYTEFCDCDMLPATSSSLLHGLKECVARGFHNIQVQVDFALLVNLITSNRNGKWPLCSIFTSTIA